MTFVLCRPWGGTAAECTHELGTRCWCILARRAPDGPGMGPVRDRSEVLGGYSSRKGTGSKLESLVIVLLFYAILNVIS
jgi:hypothetical protein